MNYMDEEQNASVREDSVQSEKPQLDEPTALFEIEEEGVDKSRPHGVIFQSAGHLEQLEYAYFDVKDIEQPWQEDSPALAPPRELKDDRTTSEKTSETNSAS